MKYIKKFETENFTAYKAGDYIKCIDDYDTDSYLKTGEIYVAIEIIVSQGIFHVLIDYDWWRCSRFVLATPKEVENWKISKSASKYNL
jgi:hypothetical protein